MFKNIFNWVILIISQPGKAGFPGAIPLSFSRVGDDHRFPRDSVHSKGV